MNFQFYVEKLIESEQLKNFLKEYPESYPCSAFFSIDFQGNDNKQHFDYYLEKSKKIISLQLEDEGNKTELEFKSEKSPEQISLDMDFDIDDVEKIITERMKEDKIDKTIQKILFSVQKVEGKDFIISTIFISGMGLIKANIEIPQMNLVLFEKSSLFDMFRIIKKGE